MKTFLHTDKSNIFYPLIIILLCCLWFASCGPAGEANESVFKGPNVYHSTYSNISATEHYYKGHKYVRFSSGFGGSDVQTQWGSHAGGGHNPAHSLTGIKRFTSTADQK